MQVNALLLVLALGMQPSASATEGRYGETSSSLIHQLPSESGQTPHPTTIPEMWGAWCARCHAQDGTGRIAEPTVTVQPMDFTDCKLTTQEPDADWERAIAKGGPGVGLSPQMPAFEDSLTPKQISGFVAHMRGFCRDSGWPMGNSNFPRPIITEKAFPENEFLILPAISHDTGDTTITALYEQRLFKRSMFEIGIPVENGEVEEAEIAFKHAVHQRGFTIVALGLDLSFSKTTTMFEPFISTGTMLRNWYLQGQIKMEFPADSEKAEQAFVYNAYLGRDTSAAPTTWTVGVELNGENDEVSLTPQVRKGITGTGALGASLGVMLPLNKRDEQGVRWVGYLLWEFLEPLRARK